MGNPIVEMWWSKDFYFHNGIFFTGKKESLHWISPKITYNVRKTTEWVRNGCLSCLSNTLGLGRHFQKHFLLRKKIIFWLNFHWSEVCSQGSNPPWVNMVQTISRVLPWMKVFVSLINFIEICSWVSNWWYVSIGSGHSLVPLGDRPLPEPMLTEVLNAMSCHHKATVR